MLAKRRINIFHIEDSELYSVLLDKKLRELADFRIQQYQSAEDAFKDLYLKPDLILLDYNLPGMNGLDAIHKFKKKSPDTPIIVLSAQEDIDVALNVVRAGAIEFINKNKFSFLELHELIYFLCVEKEQSKSEMKQKLNSAFFIAFFILLILGIFLYNF